MFNEIPKECSTYEQYITRIEKGLLMDLRKAYPDAEIEKEDAVWDALTKVYEYCDQEQFIFVLDEWDYGLFPLSLLVWRLLPPDR